MSKKMKLVVGLGNPGEEYAATRHNLGWIVTDMLCEQFGFTRFLYQDRFSAEIATGEVDGHKVVAVKPQTYVNKSGLSLRNIVRFYKPHFEDILVIHDDVDRDPLQVQLKFNGSAGGHNGVKDIAHKLDTDQFWRLKLGVGRPDHDDFDLSDYVLGKIPEEELEKWEEKVDKLEKTIHDWIEKSEK